MYLQRVRLSILSSQCLAHLGGSVSENNSGIKKTHDTLTSIISCQSNFWFLRARVDYRSIKISGGISWLSCVYTKGHSKRRLHIREVTFETHSPCKRNRWDANYNCNGTVK
jgi:hypothetical protein